MTRKHKKTLLRILIGAAFFITATIIPAEGLVKLLLFLPGYLIIGGDVLLKAVQNIARGQVFDENFLMCIATIGAFVIGDYPEGVAVMLFYQVGELFQEVAVHRSRQSISDLMDIRPDYANIRQDGALVQVSPEDVAVGDLIVVKAGEKIPLDGVIESGNSFIDTSALTGESVPREVTVGSEALSGCINKSGVLEIRVSKLFGESTVSKILDLVENASSKKAKAEHFITKFARWYTPAVVIGAVLLALIPPLFVPGETFAHWGYQALIFLVISCPCALVISVPLSFFGGIGGASKAGILVKGSNYLETLAKAGIVVFDKTGTLTKGSFTVTEIHPEGCTEEELLEYAAYAEYYSDHPISVSLKQAYTAKKGCIDPSRILESEETAGNGVVASIDGRTVAAGNGKLMSFLRIRCPEPQAIGTVVHVSIDGGYSGYLLIADEVKTDAAEAITNLRAHGVRKTVMLTGDRKAAGEAVATSLGLDGVYTELLPDGKVEKVEELLQQKQEKETLAFVGDGINDAPVLTLADVGIAMGGLGSDAAIEAADVVIMNDEPSKIAVAIGIARKTLRIVKQNIIFALAVKAVIMALGIFGVATMWEAVFADVGVSVIAICNATRALHAYKK